MDDLVFGWRVAIMTVMSVQLVALTAFLLARNIEPVADRLMAGLLFVVAGMLIQQAIGFAGFYDAFQWLDYLPLSNPLFYGPLLAGYVYALTIGPLDRRWCLAFAPGLVVLVYRATLFVMPVAAKDAWTDAVHRPFVAPVLTVLEVALAIVGIAVAWRLLRRYRRWLSAHSSVKVEFDLKGLDLLLVTSVVVVLGPVTVALIEAVVGRLSYAQAFPSFILLGASTLVLGLMALLQPRNPFPKATTSGQPEDADTDGQVQPTDDEPDWLAIGAEIERDIRAGAWYREPRFSLAQASERLRLSERIVSSAINAGLDTSFNGLINRLRVEAVKQAMAEDHGDVLPIAYACGFNSKASFNRVFRDHTGMTPTQFRKSLRSVTSA